MAVCCNGRDRTATAVGVTFLGVVVCYAVFVLTKMSRDVVPLVLRVDDSNGANGVSIMKNRHPTPNDGVSSSRIGATANATRTGTDDDDGSPSTFSASSGPNATHDRYGDRTEPRVAFFFHCPKTGGDTVHKTVGHYGVDVSRVLGPQMERSSMARLNSWMDGSVPPRRSHLIEIHGWTHPQTYLTQLAQFREDLNRRGIQVFVFTILREPVSWYRSAFNYYCVQGGQCPAVNLTVDALVEGATLAPNAQCSFFARGWSVPYKGRKVAQPVSETQCGDVASQFTALMDWVGTTEDFEATMDVLREFFPEVGPTIRFNESKKKVNGTMSPEQVSRMRSISELDHMLHVNASKGRLQKTGRTN